MRGSLAGSLVGWLMAWAVAAPAAGSVVVTEVMYDPISNEDRWEWIEIHNTGGAAVDLDGWVLDRVGDRERAFPTPNITAAPVYDGQTVANPTVVPAGGVAVLYNGPGLGYAPERFFAAWPQAPPQTTLIGVEGWASNALANSPTPSDYAPTLPALTYGLWPDANAYRQDARDFGDALTPNRRLYRVEHAAAAFGYDDDPPYQDMLGHSSTIYLGGEPLAAASWGRSNAPHGGASASETTYLETAINGPDLGSPGVPATGTPRTSGLILTEIMANPASKTGASNEWEWVEVYNAGPRVDFANTPHWLDDDDGADLATANVASGVIGAGETAVLFNASAAPVEHLRAAWDRPGTAINWIAVEKWPALANSGDTIALWDDPADYGADRAAGSVARAVSGVVYDDSAPWPSGADGAAIRLIDLGADLVDPAAWARATGAAADPAAYLAAEVIAAGTVVDNAGGDQGSPGFVWPGVVSPLPGDYNRDGRVDAADYTLWRDGAPLPTETASAGVTDGADYAVWASLYGTGVGAATSVPEPAAAWVAALAATAVSLPRRKASGR